MRYILKYYDGVDSDQVGTYDTIREAMVDARYWKFTSYEIYDTLEDRCLIDYKE